MKYKTSILLIASAMLSQASPLSTLQQPAGKADPSLIEKGFTAVFNGKDLAGWKKEEGNEDHWLTKEGWILSYDGKSEAKVKDLWTEKSYQDFTFICDWRWTGAAPSKERPVFMPDGSSKKVNGKPVKEKVEDRDSGIYLRGSSKSQVNMWCWPCGSGEVYGYRTDRKQTPEVRAGVTPKLNADNPIGEWNRFVITVKGEHLTVYLNGKLVLDKAHLPGMKKEGALALQHHGASIDFANIYIREE